MKIRHFATPVFAALLSPMVMAATNPGSPGTIQSEGTSDVSITINESLLVSAIQDINLTYTPGSASTGNTPLCIYRRNNTSVELYLESANTTGVDFNLSDGSTDLPYTVGIDGADTVTLGSVQSGVVNNLFNVDDASTSCGGTPSHRIDVSVAAAVLDAAQAGTYSDTLTIRIEPN